jgi:hypothetical protein
VRVLVVRTCLDEIDGVALEQLEVGLVYDVSASLGSYLVASGCAEPVLEDEVTPAQQESEQLRVNVRRWRDIAADFSRPRRR